MPASDRLIIRLRFEEDLTQEQILNLLRQRGTPDRKKMKPTVAIVEDKPRLRTGEVRAGLLRFPDMLRKMKRRTEVRELDEQLKTLLPR